MNELTCPPDCPGDGYAYECGGTCRGPAADVPAGGLMMTDEELKAIADRMRAVASRYGSLHPHWDTILDIEALLAGRATLIPRAAIEALALRFDVAP